VQAKAVFQGRDQRGPLVVPAVAAARVQEVHVVDFTDRSAIRICPDLRLLIDYMSATESAGM